MNKAAIFGVPRSGTSWLAQIFNAHPDVVMRYQPLFSYQHKGRLTDKSTSGEILNFFNEIIISNDSFTLMNSDFHKSYPRFSKSVHPTHIIFKETRYLNVIENLIRRCSDIKIIGIVRNPLSVLASWVSAPKEFNPAWDISKEWRQAPSKNLDKTEEFFGFEKWKIATNNFLRFQDNYAEQFILVRYDQLRLDTLASARRLFDFLGLEMRKEVHDFISVSQSKHDSDPYSVFRGKADDNRWQNILPTEICEEIRLELHNSDLEQFLKEHA